MQPIIYKIERITRKDGPERWDFGYKNSKVSSNLYEIGEIIGTTDISREITKRIKGEKEAEKYKKVTIG